MSLQCLTLKVILWLNSSAPLYSFLCFYRCLMPVVLGRRESITLSDWRKEVDSPRHHLPRVRSTDMRQGGHIWHCFTAHPTSPIQGHRVHFLHPNLCILVIRVICQTGYPFSWGEWRKLSWHRSHVLDGALRNTYSTKCISSNTWTLHMLPLWWFTFLLGIIQETIIICCWLFGVLFSV